MPGSAAREITSVTCFDKTRMVNRVTLVLDSGLDKLAAMSRCQADNQLTAPPDVMPRSFRIEGLTHGRWTLVAKIPDNHQRLVRLPIRRKLDGVRFVLKTTWGSRQTRVYAFHVA